MRVAIIAPPWVAVPPPRYGGTEAVIDYLARGLVAAGHDVLLFTTGDSTCPVPRRWSIEKAVSTENATLVTELRHVVDAYHDIEVWDPDIVHDHTLAGPLYSLRVRVPVVTTNHGPFTGDLGRCFAALGDRVPIVAISHHHASTAGAIPIAAVIHHGLDVEAIPVGTGDGGYALFLGRMSPDKGVHVAIRAAREAGVPLRIAAKMREPAERRYFSDVVVPLLGDDATYIGEVGGGDKQALLAGAACLVNPVSWPEPFGMVMIEALAAGTPVVALRRGSVPELVTHGITGFIADTEDELAAGIRRAPSLDRTRCRQDVAERFSTERMVADHVAFYERVIAEHRARTRPQPPLRNGAPGAPLGASAGSPS